MIAKPFSVGVRIEHLRSDIEFGLFGDHAGDHRRASCRGIHGSEIFHHSPHKTHRQPREHQEARGEIRGGAGEDRHGRGSCHRLSRQSQPRHGGSSCRGVEALHAHVY